MHRVKNFKSEYGQPASEKTTFLIRCRAVIVCGDKMLAVKHFEGATYYALPGGHMEHGESPLECMKREVKEELNVEIENPELKYIYQWKGEVDEENLEFIFIVKDELKESDIDVKNGSHAYEIFETHWFKRGQDTDTLVYPKAVFKDFRENDFVFDGVKFVRE